MPAITRRSLVIGAITLFPAAGYAVGPYNSDTSEEIDKATRAAGDRLATGFSQFQLITGAIERKDSDRVGILLKQTVGSLQEAAGMLKNSASIARTDRFEPHPTSRDDLNELPAIVANFARHGLSNEISEQRLLLVGVNVIADLAATLDKAGPNALLKDDRLFRSIYQQYISCEQFGLDIARFLAMRK